MFAGVFNKTPVSYSRSCSSDQFCVGSNQLHAVCNPRALLHLSTCLFPSQASLLTQRQQATQEPAWYSCIHSPEGQRVNSLWGEILAGGGWKRMDKGFPFSLPGQKVLYHIYTAARAFHGIQQPVTIAGAGFPLPIFALAPPPFLLLSTWPPPLLLGSHSPVKHLHLNFISVPAFWGTQAKRAPNKTST